MCSLEDDWCINLNYEGLENGFVEDFEGRAGMLCEVCFHTKEGRGFSWSPCNIDLVAEW